MSRRSKLRAELIKRAQSNLRRARNVSLSFGPRVRQRWIQYGGEFAGTSNTGTFKVPSFSCLHYCSDELHPGPPYRTGGPLLIKRKRVLMKRFPGQSIHWQVVPQAWYDGTMTVQPYVPSPEPTPTNLSGWGAIGWARTQPLHPIYNLGVSIGELKDLPGMLWQTWLGLKALSKVNVILPKGVRTIGEFLKSLKTSSKNAGDTYLYGAFGLAPMFQDLLFLLQMQEKLAKKLRWLRKMNRKPVKRKVTLVDEEYSENIARSVSPYAQFSPPLSTQLYGSGQTTAVSSPVLKTYQRRIWYSAKYRFYIPDLSDEAHNLPPNQVLVADLLGISADPSIAYKLIPWSWLLDWFTSTGAVISNWYAMAKYHVAAEYAYVMCEETLTYKVAGRVVMHQGSGTFSGWSKPDRVLFGESQTVYEFRQREVANPFGFGITFASLSAYQWSILAALGLSRGGKHSAPRA